MDSSVINDRTGNKVVYIGDLITKVRKLAKESPNALNPDLVATLSPTLKQGIIGQAFKALGIWHPELDTNTSLSYIIVELGFSIFEPEVIWLDAVASAERSGDRWEYCVDYANTRLRVLSEENELRGCSKSHRFASLMKKARQLALAYPDSVYQKVSPTDNPLGPKSTCSYTRGTCLNGPTGEGCIWGQILAVLNLPMPANQYSPITQVLQGLIDNKSVGKPDDALDIEWCHVVQIQQDNGHSWGHVINQADKNYNRRELKNFTNLEAPPVSETTTDEITEDTRFETVTDEVPLQETVVPDDDASLLSDISGRSIIDKYAGFAKTYDASNDVAKDPVVVSTIDPGHLPPAPANPDMNANHAPNFTLDQLIAKVRQLAKDFPDARLNEDWGSQVPGIEPETQIWLYNQDVISNGPPDKTGTIIGVALQELGIKHPLIDSGHPIEEVLENGFGFTSEADGDTIDWLSYVQDTENLYETWDSTIKEADEVINTASLEDDDTGLPPEKPKGFDRLGIGPAKTITKLSFEDLKKIAQILADTVADHTEVKIEFPQDILGSLNIVVEDLSRTILAAKQGNTDKEAYTEEMVIAVSYLVVIAQRLANEAGLEIGDIIMDMFNRSSKKLNIPYHFKDGVLINEPAPSKDLGEQIRDMLKGL